MKITSKEHVTSDHINAEHRFNSAPVHSMRSHWVTMDFFKTMKSILHTLGLYDFDDSFALVNYIKYIVIVFSLFTTFLTSFHFVLLNSSDLQKTSTALFAANIMLISTIYFTMLFGQKTALRQLLDRIEVVARMRELQKFAFFYVFGGI